MVGGGGKVEKTVVLSKPLTLEGESESDIDYRPPNLLQLISSLFKNVRSGSDLTRFQMPPIFNFPKSHLQCFGESVYCVSADMLSRCNNGRSPLDRFTAVIAYSISTVRPVMFGVSPYNPILGETHHVSRGNLNVLLEQVSHHPPVSALHATDEKENVEMIWCHHPTPKFYGTSIEAEVHGKRELKLLNHGETYVMNSPKMLIKLFPVRSADWVGNVRIQCRETGLVADICFGNNSFLGLRGHRCIKGKILEELSSKTLYEIDGHWDRIVRMKDIKNGEVTVIYNAKDVISGLKTPIVKDSREVWASESAAVWSEVGQGILSRDWDKAKEAKKAVEGKQRELLRERETEGETWVPKHFTVSHCKEGEWDCSPIQKWVPPAPITVPL